MEKKDGGFTLIELLIALAVLSIMAGVSVVCSKQKDEYQGQERRIAAGCGEADDGGTERVSV